MPTDTRCSVHLLATRPGHPGLNWRRNDRIRACEDPNAWIYWKREWLVYQAPRLRALNGSLRPPACLDTGAGRDERLWMGLEDQAHHDDRPWPLERFGTVSRHIGTFNAEFLDKAERPVDDWLSWNFIQGWTERSGPHLAQLTSLLGNPLMAQTYSPQSVDELTRLWEGRHSLYRVLNELPQTLCHLDLNGRNVFFTGDDHTVAIDWAYAGIAPLGQELAALVGGSLLLLEAPFGRADELETLCVRNYLDGLKACGWSGSERDAELGYLISLVLRMGIGPIIAAVTVGMNEDLHAYAQQVFGHPVSEYLKSVSRVAEFSLKRIDRIREIVDF
jgi:Phosphotransferase enzyme family